MRFAEAFRQLRQQRQITQRELALRSGLTERTLSFWETGQRLPRNAELNAALDALAASPATRTQLLALLPTTRSIQMERQHRPTDPNLPALGPLPELGDLLRAMRLRRGWTQAQLGAALGVTRYAVLRWETTAHQPTEEHLERVCDRLGAYPEEKQALQARRLLAPTEETDASLEACAEEAERLIIQIRRFETPLVDLNALALKRRLHLLAGQSSEALRLLARIGVDHSNWLLQHERMSESREAVQRALSLLPGRFAPERLWVNALNLASVHDFIRTGRYATAFRLLQDWQPWLPDGALRTFLLCDMAHYAALDDHPETAVGLLREAQRTAAFPAEEGGEIYLKLIEARVRMRTQHTVEDLEWLLSISETPEQRVAYLILWVETLVGAGEKRAAVEYLSLAQREVTAATPPKMLHDIVKLARKF